MMSHNRCPLIDCTAAVDNANNIYQSRNAQPVSAKGSYAEKDIQTSNWNTTYINSQRLSSSASKAALTPLTVVSYNGSSFSNYINTNSLAEFLASPVRPLKQQQHQQRSSSVLSASCSVSRHDPYFTCMAESFCSTEESFFASYAEQPAAATTTVAPFLPEEGTPLSVTPAAALSAQRNPYTTSQSPLPRCAQQQQTRAAVAATASVPSARPTPLRQPANTTVSSAVGSPLAATTEPVSRRLHLSPQQPAAHTPGTSPASPITPAVPAAPLNTAGASSSQQQQQPRVVRVVMGCSVDRTSGRPVPKLSSQ